MKKKYKLNKEWLDLMLENKNNINLTFNLSDNDTRILLTYIEVLQQENARLKDKINKANILTKKIKDDVWAKMAECYENEDNWNGDFLNIEINSIDRLLEMLKEN